MSFAGERVERAVVKSSAGNGYGDWGRGHHHFADGVDDQVRLVEVDPVSAIECDYLLDVIANATQG
jgi:S-adenosylhomocysteine hydrolase